MCPYDRPSSKLLNKPRGWTRSIREALTGGMARHLPILLSGPFRRTPSTGRQMRTQRLFLRALTHRDARRIALLAGDWDVARMTGRIPHPYSIERAEEWITDLSEGERVFGITHRMALIGVCGYMPDGNSAEIGYWLGKPWWGKGFATEAAAALIEHCFNEAGFERVTCGHFRDNPASGKVIGKLGFRYVGTDHVWCEARQTNVETLRYDLLRSAKSGPNAAEAKAS